MFAIFLVGKYAILGPVAKSVWYLCFSSFCALIMQVISIYENFLSTREACGAQVSEKGILQVLLDIRFAADVLSGGDFNVNEEFSSTPKSKSSFKRKQDQIQTKSFIRERIDGLIYSLSQKLDPIDWLT